MGFGRAEYGMAVLGELGQAFHAIHAAPGIKVAFSQGLDPGKGLALLIPTAGKGDVKDVVLRGAAFFGIMVDAESAGELNAAFADFVFRTEIGNDGGAFLTRGTIDDPGHVTDHGAAFVDIRDDDERYLVTVDVAGGIILGLTWIDQGGGADVVACPGASGLHDGVAILGHDAPPFPLTMRGVVVVFGWLAGIPEVVDADVLGVIGIRGTVGIDHHAGLAEAGIFASAAPEIHKACSGAKLMHDGRRGPFAIDGLDDGNRAADLQGLDVVQRGFAQAFIPAIDAVRIAGEDGRDGLNDGIPVFLPVARGAVDDAGGDLFPTADGDRNDDGDVALTASGVSINDNAAWLSLALAKEANFAADVFMHGGGLDPAAVLIQVKGILSLAADAEAPSHVTAAVTLAGGIWADVLGLHAAFAELVFSLMAGGTAGAG